MAISLELRSRLYQQCVLRSLRYAGPGAVTLAGRQSSVPAVVEILSRAQRPDLALALIAGSPAEAGATGLQSVLARHQDLIARGLLRSEPAERAVLGQPAPRRGGRPASSAAALREAKALVALGYGVDEDLDAWTEEVTGAALGARDLELALNAALAGCRGARLRLAELVRGPSELRLDGVLTAAGVRAIGGDVVDPLLTWRLCTALWDVDRVLAGAVAEAFCDAVRRAVAQGTFAPEGFSADGTPVGASEDPGTAAVLALLAERLPQDVSLDGTPPARGTELDEAMFLDQPRRMDPLVEVAPGVTAGDLVAEHFRRVDVPDVEFTSGVIYGEAEGHPLRMHVARPKHIDRPAPVVVFVHGGGWSGGNPAKFLRQAVDWAAAGWVAVSIGYRLVPEVVWPGPLDDVLTALRFISAHAEDLGADANRVGLVGNSAGGHLVLMAASSAGLADIGVTVKGVVTIGPLTDTEWPSMIPEGRRIVRQLVGGDETLLADASPAHHVCPGLPPVLTITGDADELTTPAMIGDYHRRLDEAGVPNELHLLPGRLHAFEFNPADSRWWSQRAFDWLGEQFALAAVPG